MSFNNRGGRTNGFGGEQRQASANDDWDEEENAPTPAVKKTGFGNASQENGGGRYNDRGGQNGYKKGENGEDFGDQGGRGGGGGSFANRGFNPTGGNSSSAGSGRGNTFGANRGGGGGFGNDRSNDGNSNGNARNDRGDNSGGNRGFGDRQNNGDEQNGRNRNGFSGGDRDQQHNGGDRNGYSNGGEQKSNGFGNGGFSSKNNDDEGNRSNGGGRGNFGGDNNSRGGFSNNRGGFGNNSGGGDRGGNDGNRGGFGNSSGGFAGNQNDGGADGQSSNRFGNKESNDPPRFGGSKFGDAPSGGGRFGNNADSNDGGNGGGGFKSGFGDNAGGGGGGRYGGEAGGTKCYNCQGTGHMSRECTEPKAERGAGGGGGGGKCFNCQGSGHMSRDCPEPKAERTGGGGGGAGGPSKCYNCQGSGHMSRECPEPRAERPGGGGGGGDRTCYNCGKEGHVSRDCEDARAKGGDKEFVDTGPSHVPIMRKIDQIFLEDENSSESYLQIRIEDDEVAISGEREQAVQVVETWAEANLHEKLLLNIERAKYNLPRKIQSYTIPLIMDGFDVKGHAETGSGKTAAFLLPIIDGIIKKKEKEEMKSERSHPIALIIEPTRELAVQLYDQARKLAHDTGVSVAVTYGKFRMKDNLHDISLGCDILVGTPGRLRDILNKSFVLPANLKYLVLDEADQLLEDSFMRDLREIADTKNFPKKEDRQTLLFSATFPEEVQTWANDWMRKENVMVSNKKMASANNKVIQQFVKVESDEGSKKEELYKLLQAEIEESKKKNPELEDVKLRRTMIFVKMKRTCDVLCAYLETKSFKSTTINGDRPQHLREQSLDQFRNNEIQIVVTTDVCARGIDIKDLDHVINLDMPEDYVSYVHRIGRTGRIKEGLATSFFDPSSDIPLAEKLVKGLEECQQEVPDWLQDAKDGKLQPTFGTGTENTAWGVNNGQPAFGSGSGFGQAGFGQAAAAGGEAAAGAAAAPAAANDEDWE